MKMLFHRYAAFVAASCLGLALLAAHTAWTSDARFLFLFWNLTLAWIPVVMGEVILRTSSKRLAALLGIGWMLTFPNAPYLATDLIHLRPRDGTTWWVDAALLGFFAGLGCLLGFASLFRLHQWWARRLNGTVAWSGVAVVFLLTGIGLYMGRFLRWSSWDVLLEPAALFGDLATRMIEPWEHPRMLAYTLTWAVLLLAGYGMIYSLVKSGRRLEI